jgi:hypothetical protein
VTLFLALFIHGIAVCFAAIYLRIRVERAMSMTGIALLMLCLIHGLPVPIYLLFNGPDTFIFEVALSNVDRATTMAQ